jgi:hypothetical protein
VAVLATQTADSRAVFCFSATIQLAALFTLVTASAGAAGGQIRFLASGQLRVARRPTADSLLVVREHEGNDGESPTELCGLAQKL